MTRTALLMATLIATVAAIGLVAGAARAEIRLGATLAVTGPAAFLGDPERKTLEMLVEQVNAAGGVNGDTVTLVQYDDGANPNKARTNATRLIEDDAVVAVIAGSTTGTTMAMIDLFEENRIPFISMAGAVVVIDPVKQWVFKTPHTDRMACGRIFTDIKTRGMARVGLLSGQGGFGKSMRAQCLDVAATMGITVVGDETYGPKDADMTPQLANLRTADGVEAIVVAGFGQGPAIVTRNHRQLGIGLPLYQSHGVASDAFIELAGAAANGVRLPTGALLIADQLDPDDPQYRPVTVYKQAYEARFNEPVSTFGGYAHDAFWLMIEAIRKAGSTDGAAVRAAIENTQGWVGVTGTFTLSPTDHMGLDLSAFRMVEIRDGKWVLID